MCVISVAILRKEQAGSEAAQAQLLHNDRSILGHLADRAPASCSCGGPHKLHSGAVARAADIWVAKAPGKHWPDKETQIKSYSILSQKEVPLVPLPLPVPGKKHRGVGIRGTGNSERGCLWSCSWAVVGLGFKV